MFAHVLHSHLVASTFYYIFHALKLDMFCAKNDVIIRHIAFSSHVLYRYGKRLKSEGG